MSFFYIFFYAPMDDSSLLVFTLFYIENDFSFSMNLVLSKLYYFNKIDTQLLISKIRELSQKNPRNLRNDLGLMGIPYQFQLLLQSTTSKKPAKHLNPFGTQQYPSSSPPLFSPWLNCEYMYVN